MSEKGESYVIRNCPFCDEEVDEGHFVVHHQVVYPPGKMVLLLALTCLHSLPSERREDWEPYTFFVTERVEPVCPDYRPRSPEDPVWN